MAKKKTTKTKTSEDIGYVCAEFLNDAIDRITNYDENDDGDTFLATSKEKALTVNAKQVEYEGNEAGETTLYKVTVTKVGKYKYKPATMEEVK